MPHAIGNGYTIRAANKLGISAIRTHTELNTSMLTADYSIAQWRNDKMVDRETQRFFRSLQTKSPFIDSLTETDLQLKTDLSDFSYQESPVLGLGIAFLLDAIAISFPSSSAWQTHQIYIHYSFLNTDTDTIQSRIIDRPHASHPEHFTIHKAWIENRIRQVPWTTQDDLLPSYKEDGKTPIEIWLNSLKNSQVRSIIESRLSQAKSGNLGDHKLLTGYDGIIELRLFIGPGYRIYCGRVNDNQLIILWGGDKSTQTQDIEKANRYWKNWRQKINQTSQE
jgi:putative addiction module killer protein